MSNEDLNVIPPVVVVLGPTASGKSALGMYLAKKFGGEIICADSRTIYKGMDIGTAKPSLLDRQKIVHHLLDMVDPGEVYAAYDFKRDCLAVINDITDRGKLPIIVGGSGLYIDSILFDYKFPSQSALSNRQELSDKSIEELQGLLKKQNPNKYQIIDIKNKRRIIRALENTDNSENKSSKMRDNTLVLGIALNKECIQEIIEHRIDVMIKQGLVEEVNYIGTKYGWDSEAMSGIGYRAFKEAAKNLNNNQNNMTEIIKNAKNNFINGDKKLVKKQLTWFKRNPHIVWLASPISANQKQQASKLLESFIEDGPKRI